MLNKRGEHKTEYYVVPLLSMFRKGESTETVKSSGHWSLGKGVRSNSKYVKHRRVTKLGAEFQRSGFDSRHHLHDGFQPSVTTVSKSLMPSPGLYMHSTHVIHIHICRQTPMHINTSKYLFLKKQWIVYLKWVNYIMCEIYLNKLLLILKFTGLV